jgi:predicted RNA-binding Zn ribbon-like protein
VVTVRSPRSAAASALRFDAGTTWLNLLATVRRPLGADRLERLTGPDRLAEWLARSGLAPGLVPTERDLRRAVELREALRSLALAATKAAPLDPHAVTTLNRWLAASPGRLQAHIRHGEAIALDPPASTSQALACVARQAAMDLAGPMSAQLSACQAHDCGAVFLDPGGRRRWCSAKTCGNRERVRAHRARARAED